MPPRFSASRRLARSVQPDGIIEEVLEYFAGSEYIDTGLIATAQAVEHYETARYGPISVRPSEL